MIITGVYTAWNVTKVSYALNENDPLMTILDDELFWSGFEKENKDANIGKKCTYDFFDNLLIKLPKYLIEYFKYSLYVHVG